MNVLTVEKIRDDIGFGAPSKAPSSMTSGRVRKGLIAREGIDGIASARRSTRT